MSFFDEGLIGRQLFLETVYPAVTSSSAEKLVDVLIASARAHHARLLVIDGLMTIRDLHPESLELRTFVNELRVALAPLGYSAIVTSSAVPDMERAPSPELTMCDGIVELRQNRPRRRDRPHTCGSGRCGARPTSSAEHELESPPGASRSSLAPSPPLSRLLAARTQGARIRFGQAELDEMMSGGLPERSMTIVAGAAGTGKTVLALQYLLEGATRGEKGLLVGFREEAWQLIARAEAFGLPLAKAIQNGTHLHPAVRPCGAPGGPPGRDLFAELERTGATRLAIDSVDELQRSIAEERRQHGLMAALAEQLRSRGVTTLFSHELRQLVGPELDFAGSPLTVLAENVLLLRFVEFDGRLRRILSILKMRETAHDHSIRQYEIDTAKISTCSPPRRATRGCCPASPSFRRSAG